MKIMHLSTVHQRGDARIEVKEAETLNNHFPGEVALVLADGKGNARTASGIFIYDIGQSGGGRVRRLFVGFIRSLRAVRSYAPTLVHVHDPELLPLSLVLKIMGYKVIYDVHEDLPRQILSKFYISRIFRKPMSWLASIAEYASSSVLDGIVAATPQIAKRFPHSKTVVVQNFPLLGELAVPAAAPYAERPQSIAYVGGLTEIRGGRQMIAALHIVNQNLPEARLTIAGPVAPEEFERDMKADQAWQYVRYLGTVDRVGVAAVLAASRVGLVVLHPTDSYLASYPVKMFEYMSVGIPVIASDFPLWRSIIDDCHCGILVDPLDPAKIAEAITFLLSHPEEAEEMGANGHRAVHQKYNWDAEASKLVGLYQRILE